MKAGNGGAGCVSFRREKYVAHGGPDGGSGGNGGDIIIETDKNLSTLVDFKYKRHYKAENGKQGQGSNKTGKTAKSCIIKVPLGTVVKDIDKNILADLDSESEKYIVARGGEGGKGNASFATPTKQAPKFADNGLPGEEKDIILELKLIADVGIIGFPNAGKSTLISKISAAKPKIADYQFTTLHPNVGVVKLEDFKSFVACDMPGLIEGASAGKGLGQIFLRHIERSKLLWHLIDVFESKKIIDKFKKINYELRKYSKEMTNKLQIIVLTKMDIFEDKNKNNLDKILDYFKVSGLKVFCISSISNINLKELLYFTYDKITELKNKIEDVPFKEEHSVYELKKIEKDKVTKLGSGVYSISGDKLSKFILKLNFNYHESALRLHKYLKENNLIEILLKIGIQEDDTVIIGDREFVYKSDDWNVG